MSKFISLVDDPNTTITNIVGKNYSPSYISGGLQNVLWEYVFPVIMTCATFILVLAFIVSGLRLAGSAIFENPRGRMLAIIGIISGVVGVLIVVNAQALVGALAGITLFSN